jgi:hypothetical protein
MAQFLNFGKLVWGLWSLYWLWAFPYSDGGVFTVMGHYHSVGANGRRLSPCVGRFFSLQGRLSPLLLSF